MNNYLKKILNILEKLCKILIIILKSAGNIFADLISKILNALKYFLGKLGTALVSYLPAILNFVIRYILLSWIILFNFFIIDICSITNII